LQGLLFSNITGIVESGSDFVLVIDC